jgi:cyanate permease
MNMGGQIGSAVTASLTPAIASRFGWTTSFRVAAMVSILGSLAWLRVDPNRSVISWPLLVPECVPKMYFASCPPFVLPPCALPICN